MVLYAVALFLAAASFFSQTRVEAAAAPIFVQSTTASGRVAALSITLPANTADGNILTAHIATVGGTALATPTGWTPINSTVVGTTDHVSHTYWHLASSDGSVAHSWTLAGTQRAVGAILEYSGVDTTTPIDDASSVVAASVLANETPALTITATAITTGTLNTMLLGLFTTGGNAIHTAPTAPSTMTQRATSQAGANVITITDYEVAFAGPGSTGANTIAGSNSSLIGIGHLIALRPATGPTAVTCPNDPV
jgi:hypothetical protein